MDVARLKLSPAAVALAEQAMLLLEECLRESGVHDAVREIEPPHERNPLYTAAVPGMASKLCCALVFGPGGQQYWSALRTGKPLKRLKTARPRFLRTFRLFEGRANRLAFDPALSTNLNRVATIRQCIETADARFAAHGGEITAALLDELLPKPEKRDVASAELAGTGIVTDVATLDAISFNKLEGRPIGLPPFLKASGYQLLQYSHGMGLWSPAVCEALFDLGTEWMPEVSIREQPFVAADRRIGERKLLDATRLGAIAFNANKLGLRSDIVLANGALPGRIELEHCDYIDNLASNDVVGEEVVIIQRDERGRAGPQLLLSGRELYCDADDRLLPYSSSLCSNQIGTSVLAIADDGVALLIQQLPKNVQSKNLTAPSGSGSLDYPDDFTGLIDGTPFGRWLLDICRRELREELGIMPHRDFPLNRNREMERIALRTRLIGFGGLVHRGGKPDFFLLARVGCTLAALEQASMHHGDERDLSAILVDVREKSLPKLDAANLKIFCENERALGRAYCSVPLALIFDMLIHLAETRSDALTEFLDAS